MNWYKLPAHRRKVLLLKWWREDTLYADHLLRQGSDRAWTYDPTFRLDDNNLEIPTKP